ncbi:MAG: alanine/ornithine racemase family PLP-dependent enzyme [Candidatus Aminicenantes bacterium]|nr:alanine/ornithine racemase family PLP-dependent enzyme [Candidatus Aminicenantes bacterium]
MRTPRIEIDLSKITHNVRNLTQLFGSKGIGIVGVTKGVCGDPKIANLYLNSGIKIIGDSRIANFRRMQEAGIQAPFLLLRLPSLSEIESVVKYTDISLNSEVKVISEISRVASSNNAKHKIILMVELGDLREGIMPSDLDEVVKEVVELPGVALSGLGANLACIGGIKPDDRNMNQLSEIAQSIEDKYGLKLEFVSVGNSSIYLWVESAADVGKINNARLGESLLLGGKDLDGIGIPGLYKDAFTLVAEVIESREKPSVPFGEVVVDAFGDIPKFEDRGQIRRIILGVGRQDVLFSGLTPRLNIEILAASSDHLIADAKEVDLKVGAEVEFDVDYGAMLAAMTSPYVVKKYINEE